MEMRSTKEVYEVIVYILEEWNIQFYVMASLVFQVILAFLTPLRRWFNNEFMHLVIWGAYLLATFVSTFAITLIYNHARQQKDDDDELIESNIFPFWAPFLLLHMGGPHTITALSMEDNNLWHRHLLAQVVQIFSVLVVFYKYKIFKSKWRVPTAMVFLVGIHKCFELVGSLRLASLDVVMRRSKIILWQESLKERDSDSSRIARNRSNSNSNGSVEQVHYDEYEILRRGYEFYQTFKGFIIDHTFIHHDCEMRKEFRGLCVEYAFEVMEIELKLMYQAMFTKMIAIQYWGHNYLWWIWQFVCHALLVTVAIIFFCDSKHHHHHLLQPVDIGITYCLVAAAALLDLMALIHIIFSHWTLIKIMSEDDYNKNKVVMRDTLFPLINCVRKLISKKKPWSEKVIQYSLVGHSLNGRVWKWAVPVLNFLPFGDSLDFFDSLDSLVFTGTAKVGCRLKKLVFDNIKRKADIDIKGTEAAETQFGGVLTLKKMLYMMLDKNYKERSFYDNEAVLSQLDHNFKDHRDYAFFVLSLHVATEIYYYYSTPDALEREEEEADEKLLCKQISQYLAYLLVLEGKITSALPGSTSMRYKDVCWDQIHSTFDHLYSTFKDKPAGIRTGIWCWKRRDRKQKACKHLLSHRDEYDNGCKYEDSLLPTAVEFARKMIDISMIDIEAGQAQKYFWRVLSEVWVELLVYASSHCRGDVHYLNKGGQFYTFVRLLMAHFGLKESLNGERFFLQEIQYYYYY